MKKLLRYEFRRILLPLCIFAAVATILFTAAALSAEFIQISYKLDEYSGALQPVEKAGNTLLYIPALLLGLLCTAVPAMQFSYRMKKRSVDLWYSLPVTRCALTFARTLSGLVLVLAPYTIAYWCGFTAIALKENLFHLEQYVYLFFASIPIAILLFGTNSFLFTRANTVGDGILFLVAWAFLLAVPFAYVSTYFYSAVPRAINNITNFISYAPLAWLFVGFDSAVRTGNAASIHDAALLYSLWAALGIAAYVGLFRTAKSHPAENAGQISASWFGYRTFIPVYLFFSAGCSLGTDVLFGPASSGMVFGTDASVLVTLAMIFAAGLIGYFIYRRSFRIRLADILSLAGSLLCGTLVALVTVLCI